MKDIDGNTALGLTFLYEHMNFSTILIQKDANVKEKAILTKYETSPGNPEKNIPPTYVYNNKWRIEGKFSFFKIAIKYGWQGIAYLLLQHGFDLHEAIEDSINEVQYHLVNTLLSKVPKDEVVQKSNENNQNLFHIYAIKGAAASFELTKKIVNKLLRKKVKYEQIDNFGCTPIHWALDKSFTQLSKTLLYDLNCDVNKIDNFGNSLIHYSAKFSYEFTEFLLNKHNFNVNLQNEEGKTPIFYAVIHNRNYNAFINKNLVDFFLSRTDIKYNLQDSIGNSLLNYVVLNPWEFWSEKFMNLIEKGALTNLVNIENDTLLNYCLKKNLSDNYIYYLLRQKFDLKHNHPNNENRLPLHYALIQKKYDLVFELLERESDVNVIDNENGKTPIFYAIENLINYGNYGLYRLHDERNTIEKNKFLQIVELLVEFNSNLNLREKKISK